MISRTHRFHGRNSLRHVYQAGKTVRVAALSLRFVANDRRTTYRAAVVVSKKVHKSAVVRNRMRRRLFEVVRRHQADLAPFDLVFTVFDTSIKDLPAGQLERTVLKLLEKAGAHRPNTGPL